MAPGKKQNETKKRTPEKKKKETKTTRMVKGKTPNETQKRALDDSNQKEFPRRDLDRLYCLKETSICAVNQLCAPCAYKIGNFDIAYDKVFTAQAPNQRPEGCPRITEPPEASAGTMGYRPGMHVLCCGDGDFSFSLAIARILSNKNGESKSTLVATSYESHDTLAEVYPNFVETRQELRGHGSKVLFKVDATKLKETLPEGTRDLKFDRIVWNFPCTAVARGQDGQNEAMEENKALVLRFVENAKHFLAEGGEIHICHKTKPPFNQWKLEEVVVSAGDNPGYEYLGRIALDRACLPPYIPRKALDKKSFPCHDACIYIFGLKSSKEGTFKPTIHSEDGAVEEVTVSLLTKVRNAHLIKARYEYYNGKKKQKTYKKRPDENTTMERRPKKKVKR